MLCPFCGKEISAHSASCEFCGNRLDASRQPDPSLSLHPPAKIGDLAFHFFAQEPSTKKRAISRRPGASRDGFCVDFQILDDQGLPIAYDGIADVHIKVSRAARGRSTSPKALLKTKASVRIKASEFQHDNQGRPYYHYVFSAPVRLKGTDPNIDVGIKLVPEGGRNPLYRQVEVPAPRQD